MKIGQWTLMHCVKTKKEKHVERVILISKKICVEVILIFLLWITFSFPDFNEVLSGDIAVFSKLFYRLICKNKSVEFSYESKYINSSIIGTEKKKCQNLTFKWSHVSKWHHGWPKLYSYIYHCFINKTIHLMNLSICIVTLLTWNVWPVWKRLQKVMCGHVTFFLNRKKILFYFFSSIRSIKLVKTIT